MKNQVETEAICCPKFDPLPWEDKILEWSNKYFIKASVLTFFYMPVNFGSKMKMLDNKVSTAGAKIQDQLCLSEHTSKWNMDLYLAVDREVPGVQSTTLSGKFFSRIYEGPFKDTGKWCKDYEEIAISKGLKIKKWFMWYTTCPKCAKKYGKNYVGVLSQVNSES